MIGPSAQAVQPDGDDRLVMTHVFYGMHALSVGSAGTLGLVAAGMALLLWRDTQSSLVRAHWAYLWRSAALSWLAMVVTSPLYLLFGLPGGLAWLLIAAWMLWRCAHGWRRWTQALPPA